MINKFSISSFIAISAAAGAVSAHEIQPIVPEMVAVIAPAPVNPGYIGLSIAYGYLDDTYYAENSFVTAGQIEGMYSFALGNNRGVIEGMVRYEDYSNEGVFWGSPPDLSAQIGGHYIASLANGMTIGGFAAYGYAPHDSDPDELYQVVFGGAEFTKPIGTNIVAFGQVGYGTTLNSAALDSSGFYNGYFVRAGASYTGLGNTILTLDLEYAATAEYEDDDEPGEMWSGSLSGVTPIGMGGQLVATYEARYGWFDALNDDDSADETTIELGIRYMFGGSTSKDLLDAGMIGLPYIPLRASVMTTVQD